MKRRDGPLIGKKIAITRKLEQASALSEKVIAAGGEAIEIPVITTVPVTDPNSVYTFRSELATLNRYDWLVITSVNGADYFMALLNRYNVGKEQLEHLKVAAVGPKTAQRLETSGISVHCIPSSFKAEALADMIMEMSDFGERILLARADLGRAVLPERLQAHGLQVTDLKIYKTVLPSRALYMQALSRLQTEKIDWITFTSSSTVTNLIRALSKMSADPTAIINRSQIACIGPITAAAAQAHHIRVDRTPSEYTVDAMLAELTSERKGRI